MNKKKIAEKVYKVLYDKCEDSFGNKTYDDWCEYLEKYKIKTKDYIHSSDATDDLIDMANLPTGEVVCNDPFSSIVDDYGGFQLILVPEEVAEKIAVLNSIP